MTETTTEAPSEPVVGCYLSQLTALLRKGGGNDDLRERVEAVRAVEQSRAPHGVTTLQRISWCCFSATDQMLRELGVPPPVPPLCNRGVITPQQVESLDSAVQTIAMQTAVDVAEFEMGPGDPQRGAEQRGYDRLKVIRNEVSLLRELLGYSRAYLRGIETAAATVGRTFFYFSSEHKTRDELVALAEELVKVHA